NGHKNNGDRVVLLSGMPEFLLNNFAEFLKVSEYYGSVMETKDSRFTGKTVGVFPIVRGKVEVVEQIIEKYNLDWQNVTAYADHYHDRFLLQKVGLPVAVNPDEKLKALAEHNNWRIEYFDI
ncbi:MAG: HAD family phosphatase, partial [Candidatus Zixiibacteriota bacterium]